MNATDVERLVRDVIAHRGLPFTVLSVTSHPSGWKIEVRTDMGAVVSFPLSDGVPVAMRTAIEEMLEAQF